MQVLNSDCPHCGHQVQSTIEQLEKPIVCPSCHRPFEVEVPKVGVKSVEEVSDTRGTRVKSETQPAEETLRQVHPAIIRRHLLGTLGLLVVFAAAGYGLWWSLTSENTDSSGQIALWGSIAGFVIVLLVLLWWYLSSIATTLTVTDDRTVLREGLIRKRTSEVQHDDVRNLQVDQSLSQRLLGIGTLGISSSGQDDLEIVVKGIPDPEGIAAIIRRNQD